MGMFDWMTEAAVPLLGPMGSGASAAYHAGVGESSSSGGNASSSDQSLLDRFSNWAAPRAAASTGEVGQTSGVASDEYTPSVGNLWGGGGQEEAEEEEAPKYTPSVGNLWGGGDTGDSSSEDKGVLDQLADYLGSSVGNLW